MMSQRTSEAESAPDTSVGGETFSVAGPEDIGDVAQSLNTTFMGIWDSFIQHTPYLVAGIFVLLLTWLAAFLVKRVVRKAAQRAGMRTSLRDLVQRLASIGIWIAGLLLTAMFWFPGLTPASAIGGAGLMTVAIGFAFQDIFENFFAGILLLWKFPFENGDFIECEGIMGQVEEVTVRMTQIRKTTGELVLVPNSMLFKNPVNVLTDKGTRRVSITAGIGYDEDVANAVTVIESALRNCQSVAQHQPVQVFPSAFGSSSVDIEVAWWTEAKPAELRASRGEIVTAIKLALVDANIEIPYPYRTLTFKEPLRTLAPDSG